MEESVLGPGGGRKTGIVFVYINVLVMLYLPIYFFFGLMKLENPDSNLAEYWCIHSHMDGIRQCIKLQKYITYD